MTEPVPVDTFMTLSSTDLGLGLGLGCGRHVAAVVVEACCAVLDTVAAIDATCTYLFIHVNYCGTVSRSDSSI
jgi:hypothetical protein